MKVFFDIDDLRLIRETAQEYLKNNTSKYFSRRNAVQMAVKNVRRLKKYFKIYGRRSTT